MNHTDQRLEQLAARARLAAPPAPDEMPFGFVTRVLASARNAEDVSALWTRFSLAALPVAALLTGVCLWWSMTALPDDTHDLARVFIQTPFLP